MMTTAMASAVTAVNSAVTATGANSTRAKARNRIQPATIQAAARMASKIASAWPVGIGTSR